MRGGIDIRIGEALIPFRLGLAELEDLEDAVDMSVFVLHASLTAELPFAKQKHCREVVRLGLIGGGMGREVADVRAADLIHEGGPKFCAALALSVLSAGLRMVRGDEDDASGETRAARSSDSTSPPSTETPS